MKLSFFLFVFICLCASVNGQWNEKFTYQNANYLWHLEAVGDSVLWGAVSLSSGVKGIFKTTDGGNTWFTDTLDISRITCMHARSATTVYCGILDNSNIRRIIKTTDGGMSWVVQNSAFGGSPSTLLWVERIYFFDDNNGFAFGDQENGYNIIYTTTNGGNNWIQVPNSNIPPSTPEEWPINTTYCILGNTIWIPVYVYNGNQIRIFKSTDKGYSWTASNAFSTVITDLDPSGIVFKNQMEGILVISRCYYDNTSTYKIYNTSDGGDTWTETTFPLPLDPAFLCGIPGNPEVFVTTAPLTNIGSAYTLDGGNTWQMIENSIGLALTTFTSGTVGWSTSWYSPVIYKWSGPLFPGTYTIGTGGNFETIQDAFDKLSTDGVAGNVTLELIDELYNAPTDSFGFKLNGPIPGAGENSRVTIKPAENKNVVIEGSGFRVIYSENTSYLTFDGIDISGSTTLTIHSNKNNQYVYNDCVDFLENSDYNVVHNIKFIADDYTGYGGGVGFYTRVGSTSAPDSNLIQNNFIKKSGKGCIYLSSYNSPVSGTGNVIRGNQIGSESDSLIAWGIQVERCKNTIVENNIIQNIKSTPTVGEILNLGINSYSGTGDIIRNNVVHNIKSDNGYTCVGILLSGGTGTNNMIYNNMVYDIQSSSTQGDSRVAGIEAWEQESPKIFYNSVFLSGTGSHNYGSGALYIWNTCSNVESKNNILVNIRDESPYCAAAIYIRGSAVFLSSSDYNDLYYEPNQYNCMVRLYSLEYHTLTEWQATGRDSNSVTELPNFVAPYLHVDETIPTCLESRGIPIVGIETDFDGNTRNTTSPDIGADEFNGIPITGVKNEDSQPLTFNLDQNYPNPFNPNTKIKYSVPQSSQVQIKVFDVLGNEVATLVDEYKSAGKYEVEFNASSLSGSVSAKGGYASGVYFYQLKAGEFISTKKMILLK